MDDIKPVAWRYLTNGIPLFEYVAYRALLRRDVQPLYDQQAIDSLRSHIADLTQIIAAIPGEIRRVRAEKDEVADYLMAAADSLRKDAERYRWLRQNEDWTLDGIVRWQEGYEPINASHEVLDVAIDVARKASQESSP